MKILVTGGTGFIGSHTTVELQQQGYDVIIVDALFNSRIEALDAIASITGKSLNSSSLTWPTGQKLTISSAVTRISRA